MISDDDIAKAIDRIARTPDGEALYLWAQKKLCGIPTENSLGALHEHHGSRKCAAELMSLMSKGIEDSGRESGSGRPIVFAVTGAKPVVGPGRSLRRVALDSEPVAGPGTDAA